MMQFVFNGRGSMVRRQEIADILTALAPDDQPTNDFQRGYVAGLERVAKAFGITAGGSSLAVVEILAIGDQTS